MVTKVIQHLTTARRYTCEALFLSINICTPGIAIKFTGIFATTISFLLWRVQVFYLLMFDYPRNWLLLF